MTPRTEDVRRFSLPGKVPGVIEVTSYRAAKRDTARGTRELALSSGFRTTHEAASHSDATNLSSSHGRWIGISTSGTANR